MSHANKHIARTMAVALLLALIACVMVPLSAHAEEPDQKTVRVGWYDSSFCYWDQFGRRCGLDYEYQQKIAPYAGWTYEYVEGSWSNLLQMLMEGKIDLLSDVSYKPEREEFMSFPELPMGAESYYIYIDAGNREITADNLASFNGKRIGVNKGSIQEGFLKDWAEENGLTIEIVPLDVEEDESMAMLSRGDIDGYATVYTFDSEWKSVPVCRVGASDYFYAVNKNRPDLLADLNMALAGIQDDDPYFNQRISEERLYATRTTAFLTLVQQDWLARHGAIRVGYRDDLLPFCQADKETGELTGALKDYLAHAENSLRTSNVRFEAKPYASTEAAIEDMKAGKIDCVFPVYLSSYDADKLGVRLTSPSMQTEMNAVMRQSDSQGISRDSTISFAVAAGDLNVETFIMDKYPASSRKTYANGEACYEAVASGDADCNLVSNYRMPAAEETLTRLKLFSTPTGESMPLAFAVSKANRDLYFIMNKTVVMTNATDMDSALASYMQSNQKVSVAQFLNDHWLAVVAIISVVFIVIVILLLQRLNAVRKLNEQQRLMEETLRRELEQKKQLQSVMEMAYTDSLTGVKSKRAYDEAAARMDQRIAEGTVSEFGVVVFDLNDLKLINDRRGHEVGDEYIKQACKLICERFKHSPVFRIGGDEFATILEGEDYSNREELLERFEKQTLENMKRDGNVVAFGCSSFVPRQDKSIQAVFERADATMYREKTLLKSIGSATKESDSGGRQSDYAFKDAPVVNVRKHILIADDIESNREMLGDLLEEDYDILYACDGVEALDVLRSRKHEIALLILDLYMPNMTGREVMAEMQVDEDLMSIPVIVLTVDQAAELECLRFGAMDFIPKPYPDIEIVKARISKCIELSENRDLIQHTQRDRLTGLFNHDYFLRYVNRFDLHSKETAFDAVACDVNQFHLINEQYGRQFGDLVLRSVGIGIGKLARKTGGISCRKGMDTFLLYCPHRDDYDQLLEKFLADLFIDEETASKVALRFGVYANAQQEPNIEERFTRAKIAADSVADDPQRICGFYELSS